MRRIVILSLLGLLLLAIPVANQVWGKAHVPVKKVQMCHAGDDGDTVIGVSESALQGHLRHGDCELPACDFNNIFLNGDPCERVDDGAGRCVLPLPREDAGGSTPGCPPGKF